MKHNFNIEVFGKNKPLLSIVLSIFIFIIFYFSTKSLIFYNFDKKIQNIYYSSFNTDINNSDKKNKDINRDIIILEIDDKTLDEGNKNGNNLGTFPFNRKDYIPVIKNLNSLGVSIIGMDIIFSEQSGNKESDDLFREEIRKAGNIVLGGYFSSGKFFNSFFADVIKNSSFYEPVIDKYNKIVYSIHPTIKTKEGEYIDHFSISILKQYFSKIYNKDFLKDIPKYDDYNYYLFDNYKIHLSKKNSNEILINYVNYGVFKSQKKVFSFIDFYDDSKFEKNKRYYDFKDKIILIGASASGIKDIFYTPNGMEQGVVVHANVINTILNKDYLKYYDYRLEYLIIFLFIIVIIYLNMFVNGHKLFLSNIILFLLLFIYPFILIYLSKIIINFSTETIFSFFVAIIISNIIKYIIEDKKKRRIMRAFSEYVSDDVAQKVHDTVKGDAIKSEKKKISIFFSDIAGFTTISEKFTPEILVEFLNNYLGEMTEIVESHNGKIDKYEGDAIMAYWGTNDKNKDSQSYDICQTSLLQQQKIKELNPFWKEKYGEELYVRMGINTGVAIVGNIGGSKPGQKRDYTVLGDNVNLASRLEGVNKFYNTNICASEFIYEEQKANFEFRMLDKIKVKGKNIPIIIYELLGEKGKVSDEIMLNKLEFEKALRLYFKAKFDEAIIVFKRLGIDGDKTSTIFEKRCQLFLNKKIDDNWDGVWIMEEK